MLGLNGTEKLALEFLFGLLFKKQTLIVVVGGWGVLDSAINVNAFCKAWEFIILEIGVFVVYCLLYQIKVFVQLVLVGPHRHLIKEHIFHEIKLILLVLPQFGVLQRECMLPLGVGIVVGLIGVLYAGHLFLWCLLPQTQKTKNRHQTQATQTTTTMSDAAPKRVLTEAQRLAFLKGREKRLNNLEMKRQAKLEEMDTIKTQETEPDVDPEPEPEPEPEPAPPKAPRKRKPVDVIMDVDHETKAKPAVELWPDKYDDVAEEIAQRLFKRMQQEAKERTIEAAVSKKIKTSNVTVRKPKPKPKPKAVSSDEDDSNKENEKHQFMKASEMVEQAAFLWG